MGLRSHAKNVSFVFLFGIMLVLFTAFLDFWVLRELKRSYQETELVIMGIAGSNEAGSGLLRWQKEAPDADWLLSGERLMGFYGYDLETDTVWDRKFSEARRGVLIVSVCLDLALFAAFAAIWRRREKGNAIIFMELESVFRKLQTTDSLRPEFEFTHFDEVLKDRILSLWEQIQTDRECLIREKETTKALVTDISHQLKTPVAALKTSMELLASEDLTQEEEDEFYENCLYQLNGLENLTKALVNVSRMEKGMIELHMEPCDLNETILDAVNRLYGKAAAKGILIEMSEDSPKYPVIVRQDRKWTTETLVNLIDNAIKYSGADTKICIHVECLTNFVRIDVEDEGIGIPKSEYHKIFKRFYRGKAVSMVEGSGIGLYLAREIMERQSGAVFVRSKPSGKRGCIFSIQLPK